MKKKITGDNVNKAAINDPDITDTVNVSSLTTLSKSPEKRPRISDIDSSSDESTSIPTLPV